MKKAFLKKQTKENIKIRPNTNYHKQGTVIYFIFSAQQVNV